MRFFLDDSPILVRDIVAAIDADDAKNCRCQPTAYEAWPPGLTGATDRRGQTLGGDWTLRQDGQGPPAPDARGGMGTAARGPERYLQDSSPSSQSPIPFSLPVDMQYFVLPSTWGIVTAHAAPLVTRSRRGPRMLTYQDSLPHIRRGDVSQKAIVQPMPSTPSHCRHRHSNMLGSGTAWLSRLRAGQRPARGQRMSAGPAA